MSGNLREKQKTESRKKILDSAAALFRKQGLQATGIDQIMKKAGLTAGAFYAHFKSKDQLVEEVLWRTLPQYQSATPKDFLDLYLSHAHRDYPEKGCPLAMLGSELGRAHKKLKKNISLKLEEVIRERAKNPSPEVKKKVLKTLSLAVGALILSRMTQDTKLSDEFLDCYR